MYTQCSSYSGELTRYVLHHCVHPTQAARQGALAQQLSQSALYFQAALNYITYFEKTWLALAGDWSVAGRLRAAKAMRVGIEKIVTTNNHLEGFNNVLKKNHLATYVKLVQEDVRRQYLHHVC